MSTATLTAPAVIYREEQNFAWWIYALLGLVIAAIGAGIMWSHAHGAPQLAALHAWGLELPAVLAAGLGLSCAVVVGVLRMTTEVTPNDVRVWFGWIPIYRHFVLLTDIERLEVVRFRPIADYGFWGIRRGRDGERVLIARGNRGVRLHLADGSRLLIGSQNPEALAIALERAMRPGG